MRKALRLGLYILRAGQCFLEVLGLGLNLSRASALSVYQTRRPAEADLIMSV